MSLFRTVKLTKLSPGNSGKYIKGRWEAGKYIPTIFMGSWQPAPGKVLELLPEGRRNRETFICYAPINISFTAADPETLESADFIYLDKKLYEVTLATMWKNNLISHWELTCTRKKEGLEGIHVQIGNLSDSIDLDDFSIDLGQGD